MVLHSIMIFAAFFGTTLSAPQTISEWDSWQTVQADGPWQFLDATSTENGSVLSLYSREDDGLEAVMVRWLDDSVSVGILPLLEEGAPDWVMGCFLGSGKIALFYSSEENSDSVLLRILDPDDLSTVKTVNITDQLFPGDEAFYELQAIAPVGESFLQYAAVTAEEGFWEYHLMAGCIDAEGNMHWQDSVGTSQICPGAIHIWPVGAKCCVLHIIDDHPNYGSIGLEVLRDQGASHCRWSREYEADFGAGIQHCSELPDGTILCAGSHDRALRENGRLAILVNLEPTAEEISNNTYSSDVETSFTSILTRPDDSSIILGWTGELEENSYVDYSSRNLILVERSTSGDLVREILLPHSGSQFPVDLLFKSRNTLAILGRQVPGNGSISDSELFMGTVHLTTEMH